MPSCGSPFLSAVDVREGVNFLSAFSVLPGLPRPAGRRLPLHHQPSACLRTISIVLSFYMYMPSQSAASHHIPKCLYTYASSQFSTGLSFNTHCLQSPHPSQWQTTNDSVLGLGAATLSPQSSCCHQLMFSPWCTHHYTMQ